MFDWFKKKPKAIENSSLGQGVEFQFGSSNFSFNGADVQAIPAYFACIRVLSTVIAQLPFKVFESSNKGSIEHYNHPVYGLLHKEPNGIMTSFVWREMMMCSALSQGNAYSVIDRNGAGKPIGIYPVNPTSVQVFVNGGMKYYSIIHSAPDGTTINKVYRDEDVIHILGPGTINGLVGLSPLRTFARDVMDEAISARKLSGKLFENGTFLGGTLETEKSMDVNRQTELAGNFKQAYSGTSNAYRVAVLQEGMKFNPLSVNASDAQLLEQIKFQVEDIARIFGVPLHMIGNLDRATFSNIEHQSINFVMYSLMPWIKRIEQECDRKLFSRITETGFYTKINVDGLLRGDYQTRMEGHSKAINAGMLTINEVRAIEGYNQIDGGDILRVPVNTAPLSNNDNPII